MDFIRGKWCKWLKTINCSICNLRLLNLSCVYLLFQMQTPLHVKSFFILNMKPWVLGVQICCWAINRLWKRFNNLTLNVFERKSMTSIWKQLWPCSSMCWAFNVLSRRSVLVEEYRKNQNIGWDWLGHIVVLWHCWYRDVIIQLIRRDGVWWQTSSEKDTAECLILQYNFVLGRNLCRFGSCW